MTETTVIDVGCAQHGGDESIHYLIAEFSPVRLIGFDPAATFDPPSWEENGCAVETHRAAVWTHDGEIGWSGTGLSGRVDFTKGRRDYVRCVDLAGVIDGIPETHDVILKIDAEGAEYDLLPYLVDVGLDERLRLVWVEWHCLTCGRGGGGHRDGCRDSGVPVGPGDLERLLRTEIHSWNR